MVKLADTLDLGSNAEMYAGSSPVIRTNATQFVLIFVLSMVLRSPTLDFKFGQSDSSCIYGILA